MLQVDKMQTTNYRDAHQNRHVQKNEKPSKLSRAGHLNRFVETTEALNYLHEMWGKKLNQCFKSFYKHLKNYFPNTNY